MTTPHQHDTAQPPLPVGFEALAEIYRQAGLARWSRIAEARRALRALCVEQDTPRERYRRETLDREHEQRSSRRVEG